MDTYRIEWNESLSIGSDLIDSQHKKLIELISAIPEYATSGDEEALMAAVEYAAFHFSDEESFMDRVNYPSVAGHISRHKKMTRILMSYKRDYEDGKTDLYGFKQFMYIWIRDHIMDEDKKIGSYLRSSGKH